MNASVAAALARGSLAANRARMLLSVACIALGVALAGAVHTIHASALAEIDRAARALTGKADLEIRGARSGFDEALFARLARRAEVAVASPVVSLDAAIGDGESLRVLGVDPFRAARLQPGFVAQAGSVSLGEATRYLDARSAWLTPLALARHGLKPGDRLRLGSGSGEVELRVAGSLPALAEGGELAVVDIATAQELFGRVGSLSRIDLRLRPGVDSEAFRATIASELPPGVVASVPGSVVGRAAALTRAYRVNLNALALVALATGMFLAFATLALQAARRRREYALLRALGVTRRGLTAFIAFEGAVVGAAGAALGTLLGLFAGSVLVAGIGTDLGAGYFRGLTASFAPDASALAGIAALGIAAAVGGALVVARSVARLEVAEALRERAQDLPDGGARGALASLALLALGSACLAAPPLAGLPLGGYAAIAAWLVASVLAIGPLCRLLLARASAPAGPVASLALAQVSELPGHLTAAIAGIVVSASLCAAMAVMVHSFRVSLEEWLRGVVGADLYVRSAQGGDTGSFTLEEQKRIAALPGIERLEALRYDRLVIEADGPPVTLLARPVDDKILAGFQVLPAQRPPRAARIDAWVSEAAVDLHGWKAGSLVTLPVGGKAIEVRVAGVFRDYARTWGAVLVDLEDYRRLTGDTLASDLALHLAPGIAAQAATDAIRAALPAARTIAFEDALAIQHRSLAFFDRTFAATYALEAASLVIALAGLTSSFAALAWARRREFGVLRHLGLTRGEILKLLTFEGAAAGALGAAIGLAAGAAISLVLVHVVNRQSFHWGMEVHWPAVSLALLGATVVVLCAAGARWSAAAAIRDDAVLAVKDDA